jgi:hypothetical protein
VIDELAQHEKFKAHLAASRTKLQMKSLSYMKLLFLRVKREEKLDVEARKLDLISSALSAQL